MEVTLKHIVEGSLFAATSPLSIKKLQSLFSADERPSREEFLIILKELQKEYELRGIQLKEVVSGYRFCVREELKDWIQKLFEEKPQRYSRAFLETIVLIAYKQPVTRAEIEHIRGVSVSTNTLKTLLDRKWIRMVGHKDVPGKPALYATTREFLDDFNLKSLKELGNTLSPMMETLNDS